MGASPHLEAGEAIQMTRQRRPESIETEVQENFITKYASVIWKRVSQRYVNGQPGEEAIDKVREEFERVTLQVLGNLPLQRPRGIVLSGLPASGKSTFARKLKEALEGEGEAGSPRTKNQIKVTHLNQDEMQGREGFEAGLSNASKLVGHAGGHLVIVDKCLPTAEDRKEVLDLLNLPPKDAMLVQFEVPVELCKERLDRRFDHPTIEAGRGGAPLRHFAGLMAKASAVEGFASIFVVKSIADSEECLGRLLSLFGQARPMVAPPATQDDPQADH